MGGVCRGCNGSGTTNAGDGCEICDRTPFIDRYFQMNKQYGNQVLLAKATSCILFMGQFRDKFQDGIAQKIRDRFDTLMKRQQAIRETLSKAAPGFNTALQNYTQLMTGRRRLTMTGSQPMADHNLSTGVQALPNSSQSGGMLIGMMLMLPILYGIYLISKRYKSSRPAVPEEDFVDLEMGLPRDSA